MSDLITPSMSHYLGEIYRVGGAAAFVAPSVIANELSVSGPAVTRMVSRLNALGLVSKKRYTGVRLTAEGEREALREIRYHRMSEAFLVSVMDYGWHEAHDMADSLAGIADESLIERMEAKAGYPTRCPHGEPIPSKEGVMPELHDRPLIELEIQDSGAISRVKTRDSERLQYLAKENLVPGTAFRVEGKAPFDGPIRIRVKDSDCVLGFELAKQLYVGAA